MESSSEIRISRKALASNFTFIREILGVDVRICSVVKGNAYGHGIESFVPLAEANGIDYFAVYSVEEAFRVYGITAPTSEIMIMGFVEGKSLKWAIDKGISFFVFDFQRLHEALKYAELLGKPAKIHVELETGLNRTGFHAHEWDGVTKFLHKNKDWFILEGVCTHYAGAESFSNDFRVRKQINLFNEGVEELQRNGIHFKMKHTACSAAMMSYPSTHMDMIRVGILQYGFWPSPETFIHYIANNSRKDDPLKRLLQWRSRVMVTKTVAQGEFIGYGTTFLAPDEMRVAVVPVGYSNGYARTLSNQGRVIIKGQRFPVIGLVNMNALMIDISGCQEIEKGDDVFLIGGENDDLVISVASFGELSNQLNYELLTRLPADIPRLISYDN
jgi:alanine racemase